MTERASSLPPFDHPQLPAEEARRASELLAQQRRLIAERTDRMFVRLILVQWGVAVGLAFWLSPRTWYGDASAVHIHVWSAILLGGVLSAVPALLAWRWPGERLTRHVMGAAQMGWSALLIHLTGGRIETHFHVFGSLVFLAFYRDWRVLVTATMVVAVDHMLRGLFWPQSVFGILTASPWRWLEHAGWVLFADFFLVRSILQTKQEMRKLAERQAALEGVNTQIEELVQRRTAELQIENLMRREAETSFREAEDSLREDRERLRLLFEQVPAIVWTTDAELRITSALGAGLAATGRRAEKEVGHNLRDSYAETSPPLAAHRRALLGESVHYETMAEGRHFQNLVEPQRGGEGKIVGCIGLALDITERKQAEAEHARMETQLRHSQKLEAIGQLAAGIAHEINTPTQFIGDNTRFLRDGFVSLQEIVRAYQRVLVSGSPGLAPAVVGEIREVERQADLDFLTQEIPRAIDQTLDGVGRVSELVRAMKEFSHPGVTAKTPIDLNRTIANTLTVCRNEWKYVATVTTNFAPDLPPVPLLPGEFNQVILNLVINAAHAIADVVGAEKTTKGTITVSTCRDGEWIDVRVTDTGTGIPAAVRERIFDPFFTTKGVGKGTGQGLSIARSIIVDKHGGGLAFETECGRGTSFIIRLPVVAPQPRQEALCEK